jgi:DNA-binding MarR family transcriptional regulator
MLAEQDGIRPREIAKRTGMSNAGIGNAADILIEKGMISKRRDTEDERAVHYHLEPAGRAAIDSILAAPTA